MQVLPALVRPVRSPNDSVQGAQRGCSVALGPDDPLPSAGCSAPSKVEAGQSRRQAGSSKVAR